MPGVFQLSVDEAVRETRAAAADGVPAVLLFGIEPQFDFAETTRAVKALLSAKVVACSAFVSAQLQELADVILPIGLLPEVQMGRNEGGVQHFHRWVDRFVNAPSEMPLADIMES